MTQKLNVIVIEDEKNICNFIQTTLENHDYKVTTAATGKEGLSCITSCYPDVVLLDLGLPDIDGLEVLRQVRDFSTVPVIVISARIQETEKVAALDAGADDYITKPFGTSELLARIRTALRHSQASAPGKTEAVYRSGDLMIDFDKRLVTIAGQEIHLTQIEYKLVSLLAQNAGIPPNPSISIQRSALDTGCAKNKYPPAYQETHRSIQLLLCIYRPKLLAQPYGLNKRASACVIPAKLKGSLSNSPA